MNHPSGMRGNSAVALISREAGDNDDFDGHMQVTPHLDQCPYAQQVMAAFEEVLARSRFMRLAPGCEVSQHVDFNYHWYSRVRIHVPVVTTPDVLFYCADQQIHMRAGECWIFDSWKRHRVINGGIRDRIHLVIDTSGSSRFWKMVREAEHFAAGDDPGGQAPDVRFVPFEPQETVTLMTERYNTAPIMAPGELDGLIADLVQDFSASSLNDPKLVQHYRMMLSDFAKDWRVVWHRYGYTSDGWRHYQELIHAVRENMHPDPRALVTSSNEIGVNPIIVQRILRPALSIEHIDQFVSTHGSVE